MLRLHDEQPFPIENEVIEYKQEFNEKCKKEIAAFLNGTKTAYIYFGIDDETRKLTHTYTDSEKHIIEEKLSHWLSSSIYYPSPVGLVNLHMDTDIFCIEIRIGKSKPYFLDDRAYVRNGSESVRASSEKVTKMLLQQNLNLFDTSESPIQNLDFDDISSVFKKQNLLFRPKALGFYNSSKKFTNTARLMSEENKFTVKLAIFKGTTVEEFKDRRELTGCLTKQLDDALTFIDFNNALSAKITGKGQRDEKRSYPSIAVREALVNAIVHRSYFSNSPIQVEIYDNRLTIMSPGPLPGGMKLEAVLGGQTLPRNPQVVKILHKLKYIEDYGTGLRRIINSYKDEVLHPEFEAEEDFVKVTLPNLNYEEVTKLVSTNDELEFKPDGKDLIIGYLKDLNHSYITRDIVEKLTGLKRTQATKYLVNMVEKGILRKNGAGPKTRYILVNNNLSI